MEFAGLAMKKRANTETANKLNRKFISPESKRFNWISLKCLNAYANDTASPSRVTHKITFIVKYTSHTPTITLSYVGMDQVTPVIPCNDETFTSVAAQVSLSSQ